LEASAVPVGGANFDLASQGVIVTQPTQGTFEAFSNVCPHQHQMVSRTDGTQLVCPFHGSHFSMTDGSVQSGPAPTGLTKFTVKDVGGTLHITA
jgi:nitrite reductase/ring-hydroxylating ferredoxin subunit